MKTILVLLLGVTMTQAQLVVTVSPVKVTGQKAVVPLTIKNTFGERVESARAAVFLLDEQGKMLGNATRWVIGGSNTNSLVAGATNTFHFVITSEKPFATTNLTAKVNFSRIVLEGGKLADPNKDVEIEK